MPIDEFAVPAATENPLDESKLPKTRPRVLFPVRSDNDRWHALKMFAWFGGGAVFASFFAVVPLGAQEPRPGFYFLFTASFLIRLAMPVQPKRWRKILHYFIYPLLWFATLAPLYFYGGLGALWGLALVLLFVQSFNFERHYVHRATVGMPSEKTIRDVRRARRFPKGLRSRFFVFGFIDALVSLVAYNRNSVRAPGTMQSPAGSYSRRVFLTLAFILLFSYTTTRFGVVADWRELNGDELLIGNSTTLVACASGLVCMGLWLCAMFSSCMIYYWKRIVAALVLSVGGVFGLLWGLEAYQVPRDTGDEILRLCLLLVGIVLLAVCGLSVRMWGKLYALKQKQIHPALWRGFVERMRSSPDALERESVFLGLVDADGSPILYRVSMLLRHAWLVGRSGKGKSSGLMSLLDQVIYRDDTSVVFVDAKAITFEVLAMMQKAAAATGKRNGRIVPVQHFTLDNGKATYLFNIFRQDWWKALPSPQRTSVILSALGLDHGMGYGRAYYRDSGYDLVHFVLDRHADVKSWSELALRIEDAIRHARPFELSDKVRQDGGHIQLVVKRLAALAALNDYGQHPRTVIDNAIDFSEAFKQPCHYYFAVGAIKNSLLAGEVGRLVAAAVLNAAAAAQARQTRVLLVIDEFQELVTSSLAILLSQARGLGVGVILANQNAAQLATPECGSLLSIVEGNASLQAWVGVSDEVGREELRKLGGQRMALLHSISSRSGRETSVSTREAIVDRVSGNLVSSVGADKGRFFCRICDNEGYATYGDNIFVARSIFHQTKAEYEKDCAMPWPAKSAETLINTPPPKQGPPPAPTAGQASPQTSPPSPTTTGAQGTKRVRTKKPRPKPPKINRLGKKTRVSTP